MVGRWWIAAGSGPLRDSSNDNRREGQLKKAAIVDQSARSIGACPLSGGNGPRFAQSLADDETGTTMPCQTTLARTKEAKRN